MRPILKYLIILASFALVTPAMAQDRPNAGGPAEQISVRVALLDIDAIDDKTQRFTVDLYFEVSWADERLASSDTAGLRLMNLPDIWSPALTIVNDRGMSQVLPEVAEVDAEGNVTVRQRLEGDLAVRMNLSDFPFDTQTLPLEIVSYRYRGEDVKFSTESFMTAPTDRYSAGGWHFSPVEPSHTELRLENIGTSTPLLIFSVQAERYAVYYLLTLVLPMLLVLGLSWMVHWVPHGIVPARIGMSTASIFSLMALGISMRLSLPKISYLTTMDVFIILSTLLVLASLALAVGCTRLTESGRDDEAFQLSRRIRIGYPIAFGLIVLITLLV